MAVKSNLTRGDKVIQFMETLTVPEGMHEGRKLLLRPFQKNIVKEVYDPVNKKFIRIVRKAIYSVAKKNGKSPMVAGLCLAHLCGPEAKRNEQIYSAATERDQAALIHRYMSKMIYADEELADELIIRESKKEIYCPGNGSLYKALSRDARSKHGIGPAVLIFDELAQFGSDREYYDTLMQGRGAHEEPLVWIISTQAKDDTAILSQEIDYALKAQSGEIDDPTVRVFLFETPIAADIFDEQNWYPSNPALGDFLSLEDMREAANTAMHNPSNENNFRNLRLNQRIDASAPFVPKSVWEGCGGPVNMETFETGVTVGGLDLSETTDMSSLVESNTDGKGFHDLLCHFYLPRDGLELRAKRDRAPYLAWSASGLLTATPGPVIDYGVIASDIKEAMAKRNMQYLFYDRAFMSHMFMVFKLHEIESVVAHWETNPKTGAKELKVPDHDSKTLVLVPHGQGFYEMPPAINHLETILWNKKLRHGGHPILSWCASNVKVKTDESNNRKFDKKRSTGRIDGMVALTMSLNGQRIISEINDNSFPYTAEEINLCGISLQ